MFDLIPLHGEELFSPRPQVHSRHIHPPLEEVVPDINHDFENVHKKTRLKTVDDSIDSS